MPPDLIGQRIQGLRTADRTVRRRAGGSEVFEERYGAHTGVRRRAALFAAAQAAQKKQVERDLTLQAFAATQLGS